MRAAIYEKQGEPLKIYDDVEIIDPRPGEVRVRVKYCGVCHSDLSMLEGMFSVDEPILLGHEASGVVDRVGDGVTHLKEGDAVVLTPAPSCGHCYYCQRGDHSLCEASMSLMTMELPGGGTGLSRGDSRILRGVGVGAFAEYVVTPSYGAIKLPPDAALDEVCVIGCAVQTGVGAVFNIAEMEEGATALIMGLGGIGISAVQGARAAGAVKIIVADPIAERREQARQFGATDFLDPAADNVPQRCQELTDGVGVDYAFETAGVGGVADVGLASLRRGGHLVCVGAPALDVNLNVAPLCLLVTEQKHISGCLLGGCNSAREIPRLTSMWRSGNLDFESMITARRPLSEINEAMDDLRAGRGIRTVLEIGD